MKELSTEEKAKAYEESLERAKDFMNGEVHYALKRGENIMCWIFPELKESEDERIRKAIVATIHLYYGEPLEDEAKEMIAWLEKQADQNPVEMVAPKFKVGDWIIQGCNILKIRCFDDKYYCFETVEGYVDHMLISEIDSLYHLWTIQDAKDGYILVDNYENIGIFEKVSGMVWYSYCYLGCNGGFIYENYGGAHNLANVNPANKEQRDLLFQKMHEAGYEWDAEKKELKKINSYCQENCKGFQETGKCFADGECKAKREAEQEPTDEEMKEALQTEYEKGRADAIAEIQNPVDCTDCTNSKGCINCEDGNMRETLVQNPAWSEEEEMMFEKILQQFMTANNDCKLNNASFTYDKEISFLKFLKDRYSWKPSEGQIKALHDLNLTGNISYAGQGQVLIELYNDLLKLKT